MIVWVKQRMSLAIQPKPVLVPTRQPHCARSYLKVVCNVQHDVPTQGLAVMAICNLKDLAGAGGLHCVGERRAARTGEWGHRVLHSDVQKSIDADAVEVHALVVAATTRDKS